MSRFNLVPAPAYSPTRCTTCGANRCEGGFVDLIIDDIPLGGWAEDGSPRIVPEQGIGFGHLYLCRDCLAQAATLIAWVPGSELEEEREQHRATAARVEELEAQLEESLATRQVVVALEDVKQLVARGSQRKPSGTAA